MFCRHICSNGIGYGSSIKYVRKKNGNFAPPPPVAGSTFPEPPSKVRTLLHPPPERKDQIFTKNAPYLLAIDIIHNVATVVAAMTASEVIRPIRCKRIFYIFACLVPGLRSR